MVAAGPPAVHRLHYAWRLLEDALFIGHLALGFAAKRWAPRVPLGTALVAAQLPDVIWPVLVLTGVERVAIAPGDTAVTPLRFESYPISHSLVLGAAWAGLLGLLWLWRRRDARGAAVLAALGLSHWLLDVASHRPDMPLLPSGGPLLGLGLWNSPLATVLVESALFAAGVALYAGATGGRRAPGSGALAGLVATLAVVYAANLQGPPPPSSTAVAVSALLLAPILWLWGNRVDRRRAAA